MVVGADDKHDGSKDDDTCWVATTAPRAPSRAESKCGDMRIDMAAVSKAERLPPEDYEKLQRELEEECLVVFELPDGSEGEQNFKMGHTVQVLKSFVEDEYGIPMVDQRLYIDEQIMLDPLTLSDYPAIRPASSIFIRVDGDLPLSAGKK